MKIGDIYVFDSYYRITYSNFYKIISVSPSGKSFSAVELEAIETSEPGSYGHRGTMVPSDKQIQYAEGSIREGSAWIRKQGSREYIHKWDGNPRDFDWDD